MAENTVNNIFVCSDGHKMSYRLWMPEGKTPKAFIQILHGMAEHSARYQRFAEELNERGFAVFSGDHRGHGQSIGNGLKGWFAENDGWNRVCDDAFELAAHVTGQYRVSTTFLLGHSMGSFMARSVMVKHPDFYSGVVIMGTGASQGLIGKIGKLICKRQIKSKGSRAAAELMDKLSFGSYNKNFEPARTKFDWLSRDTREVDKYISDDLCGFVCTNGFFHDLLTGIEFANSPENARRLPADLPLLIISGEQDPVGDNGKGVTKVYELYKNAGVADVTLKLYEGARHEILNETNRSEVINDLCDWFEGHL